MTAPGGSGGPSGPDGPNGPGGPGGPASSGGASGSGGSGGQGWPSGPRPPAPSLPSGPPPAAAPPPAPTPPTSRPTGWTGGSPTSVPGRPEARPEARPEQRPEARPQGVPSRPNPLPPPRSTSPSPTSAPAAPSAPPRVPGGAPPTASVPTPTVVPRPGERAATPRPPLQPSRPVRGRKARLALRRLDPWSVFVTSLMLSLFLAVATVVGAFVLYQLLDALGIPSSINKGVTDVKGGADPLTQGRFLGAAALLAAFNVVLLTALATLGSLLYNLVATFTGGLELTLAERD